MNDRQVVDEEHLIDHVTLLHQLILHDAEQHTYIIMHHATAEKSVIVDIVEFERLSLRTYQ